MAHFLLTPQGLQLFPQGRMIMSKAARLGWTAAVGVSNALALFIVALAPTPGAAYTLPPPNPAAHHHGSCDHTLVCPKASRGLR